MIDKIKKDMVAAMKNKDTVTRDILRVLKGELDRKEQTSKGKVVLTDSEIIKTIKNLILTIDAEGDVKGEVAILFAYLPIQMTEAQLTRKVKEVINDQQIDSPRGMGVVMSHFKHNHDGEYDGKILNKIVKHLL
tara:strand:- start:3177 stop:3578 length:402 start_codon:yes stop_codon:yes gene_type:complete